MSLEFEGITLYGFSNKKGYDCRLSILIDGTNHEGLWEEEVDLVLLAIVPPKDSKLKLIRGLY